MLIVSHRTIYKLNMCNPHFTTRFCRVELGPVIFLVDHPIRFPLSDHPPFNVIVIAIIMYELEIKLITTCLRDSRSLPLTVARYS